MPEVVVKKGESVDRALKRLKNKMESEGVTEEMRRLRAFETPLQRTRRKARAAFKRGRVKFRLNLRPDRNEGGERESAEGRA
ncbi:MAG TPA: 30S ribosomal protein S21 [Verrucomicrobiales bacterium]|nr:30S ribosomal protein S21 [Verrucomicrobiales bacterium]